MCPQGHPHQPGPILYYILSYPVQSTEVAGKNPLNPYPLATSFQSKSLPYRYLPGDQPLPMNVTMFVWRLFFPRQV